MLEPRSRSVDPDTLKDSLYRLTDLEVRVPLNLNVLDATRTPRVMSLQQALSAYLAHQIEVLISRSEASARQDRRPHRAARRLPDRLSQPRPRDRDHPHRGRAQGRDDGRVRAERPAGGGDPQHAAAQLAQARGARDRQGARRAGQGARDAGRADREPGPAEDAAEEGPGRSAQTLCRGYRDRQAAHQHHRIGAGARHPARGDDRARADHRDPLAARLDPGDERAPRSRGRRHAQVQGGRRPAVRLPRADHRPAAARRRQRARVHAGGRQAARRARLRRAGAADGRSRGRGRAGRAAAGAARAGGAQVLVATSDGRGFLAKLPRSSPRRARASR